MTDEEFAAWEVEVSAWEFGWYHKRCPPPSQDRVLAAPHSNPEERTRFWR